MNGINDPLFVCMLVTVSVNMFKNRRDMYLIRADYT